MNTCLLLHPSLELSLCTKPMDPINYSYFECLKFTRFYWHLHSSIHVPSWSTVAPKLQIHGSWVLCLVFKGPVQSGFLALKAGNQDCNWLQPPPKMGQPGLDCLGPVHIGSVANWQLVLTSLSKTGCKPVTTSSWVVATGCAGFCTVQNILQVFAKFINVSLSNI
jgi:hypothetical protein